MASFPFAFRFFIAVLLSSCFFVDFVCADPGNNDPSSHIPEPPIQSRHIQYYQVLSRYQLAVDTDPAWTVSSQQGPSAPIYSLATPKQYFPPAQVDISFYPQLNVSASEAALRQSAREAILAIARNFSAPLPNDTDLSPFAFRHFNGLSTQFDYQNTDGAYSIRTYVGRLNDGTMVSMTVMTSQHQLPYIDHAVARIGNHISLLTD